MLLSLPPPGQSRAIEVGSTLNGDVFSAWLHLAPSGVEPNKKVILRHLFEIGYFEIFPNIR
jgi:hypothetical protein